MGADFFTAFPSLEQLNSARGHVARWLVARSTHDDASACLEWPFSKMRFGYGHMAVSRKYYPAHRLMCWLAHGEPPSAQHVAAHSCNNPGCVNPHHLRWATQVENANDTVKAGRNQTGADHPAAYLNEREVHAIRYLAALGVAQARVADAFELSPQRVSEIVKRKVWKNA